LDLEYSPTTSDMAETHILLDPVEEKCFIFTYQKSQWAYRFRILPDIEVAAPIMRLLREAR